MTTIVLLALGASFGCSTVVVLLAFCRARHLPPILTVRVRGSLVDRRI